ncbi:MULTISPECIES: thiopeptide-type bacteriocin biosynthesis protein [Kitasatospora]|uniref:Thiopeptide-type bacteriocin biosynthesis domain-containing protein n=1 Tax=Kitasatospora setae (strain ATCC 33774 / DSM 43861 / JCM 3304 / KCC A-0304 / NBRC 14216 / KM-6054) TaxID=452652 RepID=E4N0H0_KITSK|nr:MULTISPECIES: thiopeptide-type bacteriocin biosynthesis protein [Kitasatospora]BAJ31654.1 hypothetical protein KSE_58840 [Kitasatospora setae KM-6054]
MHQLPWRQANIMFHDWEQAETTALAHLVPLLRAAEAEGTVAAWFVIRKRPCWRLRYRPVSDGRDPVAQGLDRMTAARYITGWTQSVYEPEVHAFGGPEAMDSAHRLFHRDSRGLTDYLAGQVGTHRRETSLLLCNLMLRSAGLDWYEQGDVWARVAAHRAQPAGTAAGGHEQLQAAVRRLLSVDPHHALRPDGPLAGAAEWARAYADAGEETADLHAAGKLHRGLRDVLAHHVIFAWNRIGLPYAVQAALTFAAKTVVFGPDPVTTSERSAASHVETP